MAFSVINQLFRRRKPRSMAWRIVLACAIVWVALRLGAVLCMLLNQPTDWLLTQLRLPSDLDDLAHRPWTPLTYMWVHDRLWHLLFNMLWLYWVGKLFLRRNSGTQLLAVCVYCGLGGALAFELAYAFLPYFAGRTGTLEGISAAVLGVITAFALQKPHSKLNLLFWGEVSVVWVTVVALLIALLGTPENNYGGMMAHVGGVLVGLLYGVMMRRGIDLARPFIAFVEWMKRERQPKKKTEKPVYHYSPNVETNSAASQPEPKQDDEMERILEKLRQTGYGALTDDEKQKLFNATKK